MGVDYVIHYDCEPKRALTTEGIMERLKGRDRAQKIIRLYRDQGDTRPPTKMGFEMIRRRADGTEQIEMILIQDLLDAAKELEPYEPYCADCPANRAGTPFGCIGYINYPISAQAERWLLEQLPNNDHPLPFMLLQTAVREKGYSGKTVAPLRAQESTFFESPTPLERDFGELRISGDQIFEILFLSGPIFPAHGSMLLQFFGGISPDLDADVMMRLAVPPSQEWITENVPFLHKSNPADDESIWALKEYFYALHLAYRLGVPVLLDV